MIWIKVGYRVGASIGEMTPQLPRRYDMANDAKPAQKRIDQFLSGPGGRADDWRDLVEGAKVWARGGNRAILRVRSKCGRDY